MATEKSVSIKELKTFIEAVEFAADADNWIPSERQWKRIRSMIDRLQEEAPAAPPVIRMPEPAMQMPQVPVMMAPSGLMPHGGMPQGPLAGPFATGSAQPVRTPDVDTSTGGYKSSFA